MMSWPGMARVLLDGDRMRPTDEKNLAQGECGARFAYARSRRASAQVPMTVWATSATPAQAQSAR